jgi:outer membrane protein TolC
MDPATPLALAAPPAPPAVRVDPEQAVDAALAHTSAARQAELEVLQANRQIDDARLNRGFGARLSASMGFNQSGSAFADAYRSPLVRQRVSLGVELPLVQWGAGNADIQAGRASLSRVEVTTRARRAELAEEARFAALRLAQTRSALDLAVKVDSVAARRFTLARIQYDRGGLTLTDLFAAQTDKDAAREGSAQALRAYWEAWYQLRRITLFDFERQRPIDG